MQFSSKWLNARREFRPPGGPWSSKPEPMAAVAWTAGPVATLPHYRDAGQKAARRAGHRDEPIGRTVVEYAAAALVCITAIRSAVQA
jgi:hypothetical protein